MKSPNMIRCEQCGHDNDLTRIFCQECGSRLERPADLPTAAPPPLVAAGPDRRLAKVKKQGPSLGKLAGTVFRLAILAAVLAVLIQLLRAPLDIPPPVSPRDPQGEVARRLIESASQSPSPVSIGVSQDAINSILSSSLKVTAAEGSSPLKAEIQRIYVVFKAGAMQVGMEQRIQNWPIYVSMDVVPQKNGSAWEGKVIGAQIGRLPIHPLLAPLVKRLFAPLAEVLQPEFTRYSHLKSIDFQPGQAMLNWSGGRTVQTP